MYDPLVVDSFVRVYSEIAPRPEIIQTERVGLSAITRGSVPLNDSAEFAASRFDDISASTEEMLLLYEIAQGLSGNVDIADVADLISKHLRRLVPATTCVFFVLDGDQDELSAAHASGENASHFAEIRIAMGQRLSGWVAANRQTILNSDPMLDLGEVARALKPPLRSCLSTPLVAGADLVGTLTVYSTHRDAFTEDHQRIIEVVARQVAHTLRAAIDYKRQRGEQRRDQFTGLPNREHLQRFIVSELSSPSSMPCSIVLMESTCTRSKLSGPEVSRAMRLSLRGADLLFTYDEDRFVALLTKTSAQTADAIARKIVDELSSIKVGDEVTMFRVGRATAPEDGCMLSDLIRVAESRMLLGPFNNHQSIH